jgi:hypothetical protein
MPLYPCVPSCRKAFRSKQALRSHRAQVKRCKRQFEQLLQAKANCSTSSFANPTQSIQEELESEDEDVHELDLEDVAEDVPMDFLNSQIALMPPPPTSPIHEPQLVPTQPYPYLPPPKKRVTFLLPEDPSSTPVRGYETEGLYGNPEIPDMSPNFTSYESLTSAPDEESSDESSDDSFFPTSDALSKSGDSEDFDTTSDLSANDAYDIGEDIREDHSSAPTDDECEDAGYIIGVEDPPFRSLLSNRKDIGQGNIYYPFAGPMEWGLASWIHEAHLPQTQIDKFLKLSYVSRTPSGSCYMSYRISGIRPPPFISKRCCSS